MSKWNLLVFGVYPYVALAICLLGSWARFDLAQYTWKAGSSQMLNNRGMRVASNLFHIGVLFVLAGHFVGLLTPASVYHHVISTENKQLLAMVSGGFFGLLCLVGLLMLVKRRLSDPRVRATSSASDILILLVLLAQLRRLGAHDVGQLVPLLLAQIHAAQERRRRHLAFADAPTASEWIHVWRSSVWLSRRPLLIAGM